MQSIPMTLAIATLGALLITVGFLYGQDMPEYENLTFVQILGKDLVVRIIFWVAGLAAWAHVGYLQFL